MKKAISCMVALLAMAACSGPDGGYIATVDGEKITTAEYVSGLNFTLSKYSPEIAKDKARVEQIKKDLLEDMIRGRLLYKKALEAGIKIPQADIDREVSDFKSRYTEGSFRKMLEIKGIDYEDWKISVIRSIYIDELIRSGVLSKIEITPAEIKKYYASHKKEFMRGEEAHCRQILVDSHEKAEDIRAKLAKGENFAALAQEFSIAPEGRRGGDLGFFERGIMPKEFDEACFRLMPGELSSVMASEFGYHIFKLVEKRPAALIPFDEVKDRIELKLKEGRSQKNFDDWYAGLRSSGDVKIDSEALNKIDPFGKEKR